jgi:hypothetical protein
MTYKVILDGRSVRHNGIRVGQHGQTSDGEKVFVDFSDPLYDEMAFTISIGILKNLDSVKYIAFRDNAHDLTLFHADDFYQVLEGNVDEDHYIVTPEEYGLDDRQVAVKMWESIKLYENQGKGFELKGGKYDEMENLS